VLAIAARELRWRTDSLAELERMAADLAILLEAGAGPRRCSADPGRRCATGFGGSGRQRR
jgi:hypothetical protein